MNPPWVCQRCGKVLDDHQLMSVTGGWLALPKCVPNSAIFSGIRLPD